MMQLIGKPKRDLDKWESLEGNEINRTRPENSGNNDPRADDLELVALIRL
jgi:hypothetical protein